MRGFCIAPIVEGKGEVAAVPALLRRLWPPQARHCPLVVNPPIRVKAGSFLPGGEEFRKYCELAARKAKVYPAGGVLILLDCEDECAAELVPRLARQALAVHSDVKVLVALACREYETWFLSAAHSLRGVGGLPMDLEPPAEPEKIRGAKEWLHARMARGYDPVMHQPLFTERMDLGLAATNASLLRLQRRLAEWASAG